MIVTLKSVVPDKLASLKGKCRINLTDTQSSANTEFTLLLCGKTVPTSLYKSLRDRVLERAPKLVPGKPYTLKKICDEPYWSGLHNQKTNAGLCMADLVDGQLVPYLFASDRDDKPLWYWLEP